MKISLAGYKNDLSLLVLNFEFLAFEIVSSFEIRYSNFGLCHASHLCNGTILFRYNLNELISTKVPTQKNRNKGLPEARPE